MEKPKTQNTPDIQKPIIQKPMIQKADLPNLRPLSLIKPFLLYKIKVGETVAINNLLASSEGST